MDAHMKYQSKHLKKTAFWAIGVLTAIVVVYLCLSCLIYPSEYVFRAITWGREGVHDYLRLPARRLETGPEAFHFVSEPQETRIRALFESAAGISDFDDFLADTDTQAFIVVQADRILYEKYFNGTRRDSIVTSFSVAKSFTSALIGIAIAEGYIDSIHDPITHYLPELVDRDPAFNLITIRDLLLMSSGIRYSEDIPLLSEDGTKTYLYPDLRQLALADTQIVERPGQHFLYNNYNPLLLGLILERATGYSVAGYLQEKIWMPLGMEFSGSWSLDSESSGFEKMESGINGRAIDFAKFGRLFLLEGMWDDQQVIPSAWVAESTQQDPMADSADYYRDLELHSTLDGYYKYMWYGLPRGDGPHDYSAYGNKGQFIYVSPQKELIIVRNGEEYGIDGFDWLEMFYEFSNAIEES